MKRFKNLSLWFSILIFAFLFSYQPTLIHAQSIEDLNGINESIGDGGTVSSSDDSSDYTLYVIIGAIAVGAGLYFFLKWAEKKRPSKKLNKAEKENSNKTKIVQNQKNNLTSSSQNIFKDEKLEENLVSQ